ncbi:MAG: tRNA(Ile)(2)-agmatinylcytidine synthase [Methanomassiliicoccaceae archaeon]|nr:tRNA(Ile)(2)-agmatinylcytidine synthase [Methanomassiliicoccaceae archaeon]
MFIGIDDTDSHTGNCTSYLMTEMIRELSDMDIIGNPRLVRLNPAVPWKTRGNGSLVLRVGKGQGMKKRIGMIEGNEICCFRTAEDWEPDEDEIIKRLTLVIERNRSDDSDPGLVVSKRKPPASLYWEGVRKIIEKDVAVGELEKAGAKISEIWCGRGVIGAACGMAWEPDDSTYEVIAYREKRRWGTERETDASSIMEMDAMFPGTFNSWEERGKKVAMVPSTPCPVLFGLRGDDENETIRAAMHLRTETADRWMTFLTNQGTDDHMIRNAEKITENSSYEIEGTVSTYARHIRGGHTLLEISTVYGTMTCAAYEPSKEFRMLFDNLAPGDRICVLGELRDMPRTLNVEKMKVISLAERQTKTSNPVCGVCGKRMQSVGKDKGYRCRECRTRSKAPVMRKETRWAVPGWYEPPTSARRHLSKPLKRMGEEQKVEFVNRRIV